MSTEKSWQAHITEAADALALSFVESISYDQRLYRHDIAGSIAHATMLAGVGLITQADRDAIVEGLKGIERDIEAGNFKFDPALEDIHMVIESALIERIGEPGRRLHTARSRNDQVALDLLLWTRDAASRVDGLLRDLCRAMLALAERSRDVVMPSYTHLQRAQPISAAAEALTFLAMFDGDRARLRALIELYDRSPLGAGAIAGTSLKTDPDHTARLLGFSGGPTSSIEATASRDLAIDFVYALSMIAMHLSRLAEQWIIYSSTEFSFLKIADRYTTGSSMMPQKRNPDTLELIRGRCANVYGNLTSLLVLLKGLTVGYNRDLQEDKRLVFAAYDTTTACLTMASAVAASASYRADRIEPTLDRGFLDATSLAEHLVQEGVAFRTAHQVVARLVALCERTGKASLSDLSLGDFNDALADAKQTQRLDDRVYRALGAANVVARYASRGAAGGKPLVDQLAYWSERVR